LWVIPHIAWCIHGTGITGRDMLRTISKPFLSGLVASCMAIIAQHYINSLFVGIEPTIEVFGVAINSTTICPLMRLIVGGGVMLIIYLWMLLYMMGQKKFYLDLLNGLKKTSNNNNIATA
jgi:hypothetical protein